MKKNLKYSLSEQLLTERLINIGDSSVVLPSDISDHSGPTDLRNPTTNRYKRTAKVLARYRDAIKQQKSKDFGNIGEQIAQAVLTGRASNVYYDQNALFSDVIQTIDGVDVFYSVKGISSSSNLAAQYIDVPKIEKLMKKNKLKEIKVGVFIINADDDGLKCRWSEPVTFKEGDYDRIRAHSSAKRYPSKPFPSKQFTREGEDNRAIGDAAGLNFQQFRNLSVMAGHAEASAEVKTKTILLPNLEGENRYELEKERETIVQLRALLRNIMVADMTDSKFKRIKSELDQIKAILEEE
ncbi:MAG: hypothetical protein CBC29_06450 [Methylococcaceae bacterium TMED69]|nr:MAG: hypothetical protein CBC29_06450 [Methylococcaceae bacterium TMED69]|tara:strand:- start:3880 stop:4767 length:888 start_codon:yes stop_codon:yes gene_type:complete